MKNICRSQEKNFNFTDISRYQSSKLTRAYWAKKYTYVYTFPVKLPIYALVNLHIEALLTLDFEHIKLFIIKHEKYIFYT